MKPSSYKLELDSLYVSSSLFVLELELELEQDKRSTSNSSSLSLSSNKSIKVRLICNSNIDSPKMQQYYIEFQVSSIFLTTDHASGETVPHQPQHLPRIHIHPTK